MTQKRFIKLCMSVGYSRNTARLVVRWVKADAKRAAMRTCDMPAYDKCYYVDLRKEGTQHVTD